MRKFPGRKGPEPTYRQAVVDGRHWVQWHDAYEDPTSPLSIRLAVVQARLRDALDIAPPGLIRIISMCSGQGRDVVGALADHPRRNDVQALLVELDMDLVSAARSLASAANLPNVTVVEGDASHTAVYESIVPVDIALVCGVFGNITAEDIRSTIDELPRLLAPGATVIWTRHRRPPDRTTIVRSWFEQAGFEEVAFDCHDSLPFGVGTARYVGDAQPFRPDQRMFTFVDV
jgi:hypothetical protein